MIYFLVESRLKHKVRRNNIFRSNHTCDNCFIAPSQLINGNSSMARLGRSTWHPRVVISMIPATGASITYKEACLREITSKEIGKYEETLVASAFANASSFFYTSLNQKYSSWTNGISWTILFILYPNGWLSVFIRMLIMTETF